MLNALCPCRILCDGQHRDRSPHRRRDSPTSAPGLAHICARGRPWAHGPLGHERRTRSHPPARPSAPPLICLPPRRQRSPDCYRSRPSHCCAAVTSAHAPCTRPPTRHATRSMCTRRRRSARPGVSWTRRLALRTPPRHSQAGPGLGPTHSVPQLASPALVRL